MNSLTRIMSYDKTKIKNQENCNCEECVSVENVELENQTIEYPKLSEEEIEQIINERYFNKDEKTKTFIRKALIKHGDRYDYSKTIYVKAIKNVKIMCRVEGHKPFSMTPNNHLNGQGCKICGIKRNSDKQRTTLNEFIERANEVHGEGTYDYSKVVYVNNHTDVIIICPKHGDFPVKPYNHLLGQGCKKCTYEKLSNERRMTKEEFIEKANQVHGKGTYDYSKVIYININTDVTIICPIHGDFPQKPNNHINGARGCPFCKGGVKLTTEEFIKRARKKHGNEYDYSKVDYKNNHTEVIIVCPKHGDFPQTPNDHLNGSGCSKCNKNKGEESIRKFLIEKGIEFEEQKKFEGCEYKRQLKFDFYLPKYNLCIESDGNVHSDKINWNGKMTNEEMEKELKLTQHRDNIKNEFCKKNGIILLRVNNLKAYDEISEYFKIKEL